MKVRLTKAIATRVLVRRSKARITVRVGTPRKVDEFEWMCPYQISGVRRSGVYAAHGVDAMQALQLVFEAIRVHLESDAPDAAWLGEPGEWGFPHTVPWTFGKAFEARMVRMIERETTRFVRSVRKSRRKARGRKAKIKPRRSARQ